MHARWSGETTIQADDIAAWQAAYIAHLGYFARAKDVSACHLPRVLASFQRREDMAGEDIREIKAMALARLRSLVEEGKLSAADLIRVLAMDEGEQEAGGDFEIRLVGD
jgi:hypothetical protein